MPLFHFRCTGSDTSESKVGKKNSVLDPSFLIAAREIHICVKTEEFCANTNDGFKVLHPRR